MVAQYVAFSSGYTHHYATSLVLHTRIAIHVSGEIANIKPICPAYHGFASIYPSFGQHCSRICNTLTYCHGNLGVFVGESYANRPEHAELCNHAHKYDPYLLPCRSGGCWNWGGIGQKPWGALRAVAVTNRVGGPFLIPHRHVRQLLGSYLGRPGRR
jgi:hypothetical protein